MALKFNGTSQALNTSTTLNLTAYTQLTVSFWLYWDAFANDDKLAWESSTNFNTNAGGILCDPDESSTSKFVFAVRNAAASDTNTISFTRPSAGVWHHYLVTFALVSGSNWVTAVYLDSVSQTLSSAGGITCPATSFGNYTWYFMSRAASSLWGAGRLCEFSIWPGVQLGQAEAYKLYSGITANKIRTNFLRYYWPIIGEDSPVLSKIFAISKLTLVGSPTLTQHPINIQGFPRRGFLYISPSSSHIYLISALWDCAGNVILDNGRIAIVNTLINVSGDLISSGGRRLILSNILDNSGDTTASGILRRSGIFILNNQGDYTESIGRISQTTFIVSCAGDYSETSGKFCSSVVTFSNTADMSVSDGRISPFNYTVSPAGDINLNGGKISRYSIIADVQGNFQEIAGKLCFSYASYSPAGDSSLNAATIYRLNIPLNNAGDFNESCGKIISSNVTYLPQADLNTSTGRISIFIATIDANGYYTESAGRILSGQSSYVINGDYVGLVSVRFSNSITFSSSGDFSAAGIVQNTVTFFSSAIFEGAGEFTSNAGKIALLTNNVNSTVEVNLTGIRNFSTDIQFSPSVDCSITTYRGRLSQLTINASGDSNISTIRLTSLLNNIYSCECSYTLTQKWLGGITLEINPTVEFNATLGKTSTILLSSSTDFSGEAYINIGGGKIARANLTINGDGNLVILIPSNTDISYLIDFILHSNSIELTLKSYALEITLIDYS